MSIVKLEKDKVFNQKSGNKISGKVTNIDDKGNYTVITSMGEVVFNQTEITRKINYYFKIADTVF